MIMDRTVAPTATPEWEGPASPQFRRMEHSSTGWTRGRNSVLGQPQDGAVPLEVLRLLPEIGTRALLPSEPADAAVTGGTRSLMRRLSGLNIGARPAQPAPVPAARTPMAADLRRTA